MLRNRKSNWSELLSHNNIVETSCCETSAYLTHKAIEFGYHQDKISKTKNLDIRDYLDLEIFVLDSKEEIIELEKRASYC